MTHDETMSQIDRNILPYRCITKRITRYDPKFTDITARVIAAGFTQADLAWILGVAKTTIIGWCDKYPEFKSAYESGKEHAKRTLVATGLQAACGYNLTSVRTKVTVEGWIEDPEHPGTLLGGKTKTETTTDTTHYPPNANLLIYMLSNIDRQLGGTDWLQKSTGPDNGGKTLILNVGNANTLEADKINTLIRGNKQVDSVHPCWMDERNGDSVTVQVPSVVKELANETSREQYQEFRGEVSEGVGEEPGFDAPLIEGSTEADRHGPPDTEESSLHTVDGYYRTSGVDSKEDDVF
jgi:hypothetical protein